MKKKTNKKKDTDFPKGKLTVVEDFLPSPEELISRVSTKKVTIALDQETIEFFKGQAELHGGKYQQMIREVLRLYAKNFEDAS